MSDKNCSTCRNRHLEWTEMPCLNCKGDISNWKNWEPAEQNKNKEMKIGERIKREREVLGLSQEALALAAGISQRSIGHYELGQRDPQSVTINKIMGAMGFKMQFVKEG